MHPFGVPLFLETDAAVCVEFVTRSRSHVLYLEYFYSRTSVEQIKGSKRKAFSLRQLRRALILSRVDERTVPR